MLLYNIDYVRVRYTLNFIYEARNAPAPPPPIPVASDLGPRTSNFEDPRGSPMPVQTITHAMLAFWTSWFLEISPRPESGGGPNTTLPSYLAS